jgi:uncharacterized protein (DUF433 family)
VIEVDLTCEDILKKEDGGIIEEITDNYPLSRLLVAAAIGFLIGVIIAEYRK